MLTLRLLRSRALLASLATALLLMACMQAAVQPRLSSGGALAPGDEAGSRQTASGPLKVVFSAPQGEAVAASEVSVVFDRPVHALGTAADAEPPFKLSPATPGRFRWVGSRAVVFTPEAARLAGATRYEVEVPAGIRALDGSALKAAHRFVFETPRPRLVRSEPHTGARGLTPDTQLRLELSQAVLPEQLSKSATLWASKPRGREQLAFDVVVPDPKRPKLLVIRPKKPLPVHSAIELTLLPQLVSVEGPLSAEVEQSLSFRTYDPLSIDELSCERESQAQACAPESSLGLVFNNPVQLKQLQGKLHVTPDVGLSPLFASAEDGAALTTFVPLHGRFQAGGRYKIEVAAGVTDRFGQRLAKAFSSEVRFADHYPRVDIGAQGRNFVAGSLAVPIASRNVAAYDLFTAALRPEDLLAYGALHQQGGVEDPGVGWLAALTQARMQRVTPGAPRNQIAKTSIDTLKLLGSQGRGVLAIGARYQADANDYGVPPSLKVVSLSDLGISAKISRHGSLVWVTRRTTNSPVDGAEVRLLVEGRPERKYLTRSDGLAHIPVSDFAPNLAEPNVDSRAVLLARFEDDTAFQPVSEYIDSYRLDVPTDFSGELRPYGIAFTDRGIYRPGDEVAVKGIVRNEVPTGNALPGEKSIKVVLRSPNGEELGSQQTVLTDHGTFSVKLRLPLGAELGTHRVIAVGLGHERVVEAPLEVAEYKPVEMRLEGTLDRASYVRGDQARLEVGASYLFGAPMAGAAVSLSVSRQTTGFVVPDSEGFVTDASQLYSEIAETSPAGELRRENRKLDEQGRVQWIEKLELPGQRGPELLRLDAEVTDVSRRTVATSRAVVVHPASFYLGLKTESSGFVSAPGKLEPQVVSFDLAGKRLSGQRVALELVERRYTFAREEAGGDLRSVSRVVDKVVGRCELTTAAQPTTCPLAVSGAGYYLVVARAKDARGQTAESALGVYASGGGEPTWAVSDRRSVALVLDKKSYAVGDRARVMVKSPYREAEALVTVERSGVYQAFRLTLLGTAPSFEIPVTSELLPNAFIGVQLLPKRSGKGAPVEPGSYRLGYAQLSVNAEARRLRVAITPSKRDLRPSEAIDVKLAVRDARGAPAARAEVTLYAVDEGVLSLIDYRTPDPLATFSGKRALQVATLESRDAEGRIALESLGVGRDKGRDGGGGGGLEPRRDFRQTAYFNPRILTDERGEAKVSFKLPEALTTYRLMAVAVGQSDRYGFSEDRVTTSKRLMARPALPRFLRVGDRFEAGVVVSKKGMKAGVVRVTAQLSGLEPAAPVTKDVEVPENGSVEVRFPVSAARPGTAKFRFDVASGAERDSVVLERRVSVPMTPESTAIYGVTTGAMSERLGDLTRARTDTGELSVALASTALVGVDQTALDLIEYPYGCTEQLASRLLPLTALTELAKALGFRLPKDAARRAEATVAEILTRQRGDGGFGMWPETQESSDWVSPYAALALSRAARGGVRVPKAALTRARDYLRRYLDSPLAEPWQLASAVLAVDVLGELGSPDAGHVNRLFERRKQLPLFAKALLLHAALDAKLASDVPRELLREIEASLHPEAGQALVVENAGDEYAVLLDSAARTQALVLRALAVRGKHPLLASLARGLLASRKQGKFRSTQEAAWALLALDDYRRVAEPQAPHFDAQMLIGAEPLGQASFNQASALSQRFEVPMAKLAQQGSSPLIFRKEGTGSLFYEARLRYARRDLPSAPLDAGFYIEKSLRSVRPEALSKATKSAASGSSSEFVGGDLVLVDLTVVTPTPRRFVVLDDPLPAGLEAIDQSLATAAAWLNVPETGGEEGSDSCADCEESQRDALAHGRGYQQSYVRRELRDDRVLFFADHLPAGMFHYRYLARATTLGKFVLPPTRAEEMYSPEVFGRTAAGEVSVR